jgi:lysophospholipase L1-like esterase
VGRGTQSLQAVALALGGLLLPLMALELWLRLAGRPERIDPGPDFDRPDVLYTWQRERANPWLRVPDAAQDVFRLAIIGDSFTVGQGVQFDDAYPARLERWLNYNAGVPPVDVLVHARQGTSTREQLRFLDRALAEEPHLVLLGLFLNDPERPGDPDLAAWRARLVPRPPAGAVAALARLFRTVEWTHTRWERWRAARAGMEYYHFLSSPANSGWRPFVEALAIFAERCRQEDVPLAVVIFPGMGYLGPDYPHGFAHEALDGVLEPLGIPTLDLLPAFADKSPTRMAVLPGVDHHPSEIAHRLAAETILDWLLDEHLLPAHYRPAERDAGQHEEWRKLVERLRAPPEAEAGTER